jgi:predicted HicB family RNase H-like nuclease
VPQYRAAKITVEEFGPAFNLRLPESMKQKLKEEANANQRSLNAEIFFRLLRSFDGYRR